MLPFRKISSTEVALSSYYGNKLFVSRSERAVFNYNRWLTQKITAKGLDADIDTVSDLKFSDVFNKDIKGSSVYAALSRTFASFKAGDCVFEFDRPEQRDLNDTTMLFCGTKGDRLLYIDDTNTIYEYEDVTQQITSLGTIEEVCQFSEEEIAKKPIEIVELSLGGKSVPIGVVLGWKLGVKGMIKALNIDARIYDRHGEGRYRLQSDEFKVTFEDKMIVARKGDRKAEFVIGSLLRYRNYLKRYPLRLFEKTDGWQAVMDKDGLGARYSRELKNIYDLFIDPVTEDILKDMEFPTTLSGLFIKAVEVLLDDAYKDPTDFYEMRDRNYERISGFIYTELMRSVKQYRSRASVANASLTMNPQAVWMNVVKDPACAIVEESNPIHNIKERDVVIYGGIGGRTGRTLTEKFRTYSHSDLGVTSEGTVDNGSVGTIMYLSGDPDYGTVYGRRRKRDEDHTPNNTQLQSISAMITPASDRDD